MVKAQKRNQSSRATQQRKASEETEDCSSAMFRVARTRKHLALLSDLSVARPRSSDSTLGSSRKGAMSLSSSRDAPAPEGTVRSRSQLGFGTTAGVGEEDNNMPHLQSMSGSWKH